MKNRIELKLKFPAKGIRRVFGRFHKRKIGFRFTHFALFEAMEVLNCEPEELKNYSENEQIYAIAYGAALYDAIKTGKKADFTFGQMKEAFMNERASELERKGELIGKTWANASYPKWMEDTFKEASDEVAKKKSQNKTS
jgi:hypothetical protein